MSPRPDRSVDACIPTRRHWSGGREGDARRPGLRDLAVDVAVLTGDDEQRPGGPPAVDDDADVLQALDGHERRTRSRSASMTFVPRRFPWRPSTGWSRACCGSVRSARDGGRRLRAGMGCRAGVAQQSHIAESQATTCATHRTTPDDDGSWRGALCQTACSRSLGPFFWLGYVRGADGGSASSATLTTADRRSPKT